MSVGDRFTVALKQFDSLCETYNQATTYSGIYMAKSKSKRRTSAIVRPKKKNNPAPFYPHGKNTIRIKTKALDKLRDDGDFVALIRVGRAMSALSYAVFSLLNPPSEEDELLTRHRYRTLLVVAGYITATLEVAESLRLSHGKSSFFDGFNEIFSDDYTRARNIVRKVRHNVGFHLDAEKNLTKTIIADLKLSHYDFVSGNPDVHGSLCFPLADIIDVNYLAIDLKIRGSKDDDVLKEIFETIVSFNGVVYAAADKFIEGIIKKLGLVSDNS